MYIKMYTHFWKAKHIYITEIQYELQHNTNKMSSFMNVKIRPSLFNTAKQ